MSGGPPEPASGEAERLARSALQRYDLVCRDLALIKSGENSTFRLTMTGRDALVRVHSGTHTSRAQVECEGLVLDYLRTTGIATFQEPIRNRDGKFATCDDSAEHQRPVSVLGWINAPVARQAGEDPRHYQPLGELLAKLHNALSEWRPATGFTRPDWNATSLISADGALGFGRIGREKLRAEAGDLFDIVEEALRGVEDSLAGDRACHGLIHADLDLGNVLCQGSELIPIDFDDCGWGCHLYDLAVPLATHWLEDDCDSRRADLLAGYRRHRPLPVAVEAPLRWYVAARCGFAALWLTGRGLSEPSVSTRSREITPRLIAAMRDISARG